MEKIIEIKNELAETIKDGKADFAKFAEAVAEKCDIKEIVKAYYWDAFTATAPLAKYMEDFTARVTTEDLYLNGNAENVENAKWLVKFFDGIACEIREKIEDLEKELKIFEDIADKACAVQWSAETIELLTADLAEAEEEAGV